MPATQVTTCVYSGKKGYIDSEGKQPRSSGNNVENLYFHSSHHLLNVSYYSRVKIWPAPNVWVFIAQLVEHSSTNAKSMVRFPLKPRNFFPVYLQLLKLQLPVR